MTAPSGSYPQASSSDPESPSASKAGDCLSDPANLASIVACDTEHRAEIVSTAGDGCTREAAVAYAGGDPSTDLFSDVVQMTSTDGYCVLELDGATATASVADSLSTDQGHGLRECLDARSSSFVPCAEDHTGEVVDRVEADSREPLGCEAAAEDYLGQSLSERYDELEVDEVSSDVARRCMVGLRSDSSWLLTPLRGLGNGEIEASTI